MEKTKLVSDRESSLKKMSEDRVVKHRVYHFFFTHHVGSVSEELFKLVDIVEEREIHIFTDNIANLVNYK